LTDPSGSADSCSVKSFTSKVQYNSLPFILSEGLLYGTRNIDFQILDTGVLSLSNLPVPVAGQLPAPVDINLPIVQTLTHQRIGPGGPIPMQSDPLSGPDLSGPQTGSAPAVDMPGVLTFPITRSVTNSDYHEMGQGHLNGTRCRRLFTVSAKCCNSTGDFDKQDTVPKDGTIQPIPIAGYTCVTGGPNKNDAYNICCGK
jgi:hypothetical protein